MAHASCEACFILAEKSTHFMLKKRDHARFINGDKKECAEDKR